MSNLPAPKYYTYQLAGGGGGGGGGSVQGSFALQPQPNATIFVPAFPIDWNIGLDWAVPEKQAKVVRGNAEGYECDECSDFYPMAELNMPEGSKNCSHFRCYGCRKGLITIFGKIEK
jgi:hypothetical protein